MVLVITVIVAWGVLTFGAVYEWGYWPMLLGAVATSIWLSWRNRAASRPRAVIWTGLLTLAAIACQLVPLPPSLLTRISEPAIRVLNQQDILFANSAVWHPLSIDPRQTAAAAGFIAVLWVFALALSSELSRPHAAPPRSSSHARRPSELAKLCRHLVVLAGIVAIIALCQAAAFNGKIYGFWTPFGGSSNVFGPFVNRNHFAGWMVLAAGLAGGYLASLMATSSQRGRGDWHGSVLWLASPAANQIALVTTALIVMSVALLWSLSRSGILAYAAAISVLVAASRVPRDRRASIAWLLGLVAAATVIWRDTAVLAQWYDRSETLFWRIALWKDSIAPLKDFFWTGAGLNTYERIMWVYPLQYPALNPVHAHNDYLQLAIEGGLVVGLPVIGLVAALVHEIRRRLCEEQHVERYWLRMGAIAGLIGILVQAGADFSLRIPGVAVLASVLVAIAMHQSPEPAAHTHLAPRR